MNDAAGENTAQVPSHRWLWHSSDSRHEEPIDFRGTHVPFSQYPLGSQGACWQFPPIGMAAKQLPL